MVPLSYILLCSLGLEEEFCKFLRKWDAIKNYADFMRYYTYLNFIWKEKNNLPYRGEFIDGETEIHYCN